MDRYDPPTFQVPPADLNTRVKAFFDFWARFYDYTRTWLNALENTGQFTSVASASSINLVQPVLPVTGTTTVSTLVAPSDMGQCTLLAVNGFSLATGGNIAANRTLTAGQAVTLFKNFLDNKWYVD